MHPPLPPPMPLHLHPCRLCHMLGVRWGAGSAARMTPVTEPLWVLERLPGEPGAPLSCLLLITPDWVKACRSQTLSRRTGKLDLTQPVAGRLGIAPARPAVQCLHWLHVYAHAHIFVHVWLEGEFCLQWRPTCRRAPRELATLLATPFLTSPFSAVVFFFSNTTPPPPSIFHISGSDSHSSKWDLKCLNSSLLRICHIFCQR